MSKTKTFTDKEKQQIIYEYTVNKRSAKSIGEEFGCSSTTLLKNLKEWGIVANSRTKNLTNQIFGKLTALRPAPKRNDKYSRWICQCQCGNVVEVRTDYLTSGHTTSCGCALRERMAKRKQDLTGKKFGEWTVLSEGSKESYWLCRCSCGVEREVYSQSLKSGKSLSCGHLFKNEIRKPIIGKRYGNLVVLDQIKENDEWYCICKCDCGNQTKVTRRNLVSGNTQSCGCIKSKGEANIKRLLQANNISFIPQWTPKDCPNQRYKYDFYLNVLNRVIEFDGPQHTGQVGGYYTQDKVNDLIKHDKEKNQYCFDHNIPIVRIPYAERDTLTLDIILGDKYLIQPEAQEEIV